MVKKGRWFGLSSRSSLTSVPPPPSPESGLNRLLSPPTDQLPTASSSLHFSHPLLDHLLPSSYNVSHTRFLLSCKRDSLLSPAAAALSSSSSRRQALSKGVPVSQAWRVSSEAAVARTSATSVRWRRARIRGTEPSPVVLRLDAAGEASPSPLAFCVAAGIDELALSPAGVGWKLSSRRR